MNIESMTLPELLALRNAIVAEAKRRMNEAAEIVGTAPSTAGNFARRGSGRIAGRSTITTEAALRELAEKGLTVSAAARELGVASGAVWVQAHRYGIIFTKGSIPSGLAAYKAARRQAKAMAAE